ncbi:glycoside hydrolase family 32 protein [Paenibacillus spongiae]|uniref:Glycoside hydrolase family 32 protein n=1 Tax=Paenibacillus spongiae TaxID=2909671 RepID=A0ABY5SID2_9BACL|nr:glycoside hydrolase family 32 protein [Paenibacillus spongiae]UVI33801.1 glycoside hydrolase family 32 protein [Paenibacillus spongiae]
MNDPNGLVFYNGEYHLFYQHHPNGMTWGPMHWGHAVSPDMVHWEHREIALAPDEHGTIFSGSAVVDWNDTTGLFGGKSGLVAIFTHHDEDPVTGLQRQRQSLAYSSDSGRSWTKYAGNPVLEDPRHLDYRDPKVFWHDRTSRWVMILATGHIVTLYHSPDLIHWTFASEFGQGEGFHEGVWECPDLFELPIDGEAGSTKWVMLVSSGGAEFGARTQYFIGEFDGTTFTNDQPSGEVRWLDYGRDNYAGVSWSDVPKEDGRRIYIGWMSNFHYAHATPTEGWRSAMTIPRVLALKRVSGELTLHQQPVKELASLRSPGWTQSPITIGDGFYRIPELALDSCEIIAEFAPGTAEEIGFKLRVSEKHETIVGYVRQEQELFVDRSRSGDTAFHEKFPGRHTVKLGGTRDRLKLHIWVDKSSIEVFAGDGEAVITDLIFPDTSDTGLEIYTRGGAAELISMEIYRLRSI